MDVPAGAWPDAPGAAPEEKPPEAYAGTPAAHTWTALFLLAIAFMAYDSITLTIDGIQAALDPDGAEAQAIEDNAELITPGLLWLNSAFILFIFGLIPLGWVALTRVKVSGTWRYLHMDGPDIGKRIGIGLALGVGMWLALIVVNVIRLAVTGELDAALSSNSTEESAVTRALLDNLNWPLALFIALVAGVAEEIFFRGVLQRWIGVWGQAIVFGLTHAGYGTVDQIVFPFLLGIAFGFMVKRGYGLWMAIAAHFMFDFVQLSLALLIGTG